MRYFSRQLASMACACVMLGASAFTLAQTAAPAREAPRPEDIDPAVNTSASVNEADTGSPSASAEAPTSGAPASPAASGAGAGGASSASTTRGVSASSRATTGDNTRATTGTGAAGGRAKGKALDRLKLDTTQITGNRELPKVLYIVPWKRADLGDLVGKPVNSLLDEVLTPVDRDVFRRENRYYRALTPAAGQPAGAATAPDSGAAPDAGAARGSAAPAARDER